MLARRRLFHFITLLLILGLVLAACERPIPGSDGGDATEATPDANVGGGADAETAPYPADTGESETPRVEEEAAATPEPAAAEPETAAEPAAEPAAAPETTDSGEAEGEDPETTTEEQPADEATTDEAAAEPAAAEEPTPELISTTPVTHTVQAGENLYRIGLKYGISWVRLAEYNRLSNPNRLTVGQVLKLTDGDTPPVDPTPSPSTETTYIVKAGDNLFRIGLAYGVSWVQIAEANGIVNPNQIKVGQELKIPVSAPGPKPGFTHLVKRGETLFLISLRYGIPWTAIAEANNISSPYVIYVGQTLSIPGD